MPSLHSTNPRTIQRLTLCPLCLALLLILNPTFHIKFPRSRTYILHHRLGNSLPLLRIDTSQILSVRHSLQKNRNRIRLEGMLEYSILNWREYSSHSDYFQFIEWVPVGWWFTFPTLRLNSLKSPSHYSWSSWTRVWSPQFIFNVSSPLHASKGSTGPLTSELRILYLQISNNHQTYCVTCHQSLYPKSLWTDV